MSKAIVREWEAKGSPLEVPGTAGTRIWRDGSGPPVVLLHGVPSSAFLYRKLLPELASRGLEGIALDFPGLGFADRPADFDYSWTGLSAWLERAIDAAGLDSFHLVVHDLGGPVGFDLIRRIPDRILSLTVLNTLVDVASFKKPWVMRPFEVRGLRRLWVWQLDSAGIYPFFRWKGVLGEPSYGEVRAYGRILTRGDGGAAFLKIMRSFETTDEFEQRIKGPLAARAFPAQIVWGRRDTELSVVPFADSARAALGLTTDIHEVDGRHFLQEDAFVEIAERISQLVLAGTDI